MKKELILTRGCPGSGKSTLAKELASTEKVYIFCTDDWLINEKGDYEWTIERSLMAHERNQREAFKAMREGLSPIIIDNTNIRPLVAAPYIRGAVFYNYKWDAVEPDTSWARNAEQLFIKNKHAVPKKIIEERLRSLETFPLNTFKTVLSWEFPMDPEVVLRMAQLALEKREYYDADHHLIDYRDWRKMGGYQPDGGDDVATSLENKMEDWRYNTYSGLGAA
jgi:predicted kinase